MFGHKNKLIQDQRIQRVMIHAPGRGMGGVPPLLRRDPRSGPTTAASFLLTRQSGSLATRGRLKASISERVNLKICRNLYNPIYKYIFYETYFLLACVV